MKKFSMLIFTIIIFSMTYLLYLNENADFPNAQYKIPKMSFYSDRFGEVKNLESVTGYDSTFLFLLSSHDDNNESELYSLNLSNNKMELIKSFEPHDKFKDTLIYSIFNSSIVTANKNGLSIDEISFHNKGEYSLNEFSMDIKDFSHVDSFSFDNRIYYSKENDNLIHGKSLPIFSSCGFFTSPVQQDFNYYKKTYSIVQAKTLGGIIYYTKLEKDGLNLYELSGSNRHVFSEKLLVKNYVHGNRIINDDGLCGMYEKDNKFHIFIKNTYKDLIKIDEIPKNTDLLGQVPSVLANNQWYNNIIAYTSFDENHLGQIHVKKRRYDSPKVIVKDEPIIGPIKTVCCDIDDVRSEKVLFTTLEKGKIKIKLCDIETSEIEDITHYFK